MNVTYDTETTIFDVFQDGKRIAQFTKELVETLKHTHLGLDWAKEIYAAIWTEMHNGDPNELGEADFTQLEEFKNQVNKHIQ